MAPSLTICPNHKSTLHLIGWVTFLKHKPVYSTTSLVIIFNPILGFCFPLWSHLLALPVCPLPSTSNKRHVVLCTGPEVLCLCVLFRLLPCLDEFPPPPLPYIFLTFKTQPSHFLFLSLKASYPIQSLPLDYDSWGWGPYVIHLCTRLPLSSA